MNLVWLLAELGGGGGDVAGGVAYRPTDAAVGVYQDRLAELDAAPDYGVRSALVEAIAALAERGHADLMLGLLADWVERTEPNVWVITRAASASWAQEQSEEMRALLEALEARVGRIRPVLRALERHAS